MPIDILLMAVLMKFIPFLTRLFTMMAVTVFSYIMAMKLIAVMIGVWVEAHL